ncbi:MATE family efflux transporter [Acidaminobacter sp. JC074]|uniref:MATE family efflux transporter n=1 Tax=Acidaminobacter sp. JC074 TaxID=2530199 RepID=UPI001F0E7D25|nr:MATE family efflux transporter [Acidaminobacter sp. JC074]MCH4887045.1 MATE family efflux transporter [Acidaminobacter sp. JC074]
MFSQKWTYKEFIKYVMPAVLTMVFISLYTIVDGLFVARFVGTEALASMNLVYPIYNLGFAITVMLAVGGSALISIALGEKDKEKAINRFSLISLVILVTNILVSILGIIFIEQILNLLGVTQGLYADAKTYGLILFIALPVLSIKVGYEYFLRVDDCSGLSLAVAVVGGLVNIVLDYLFVAKFSWGIAGAGFATLLGIITSAIIGAVHFIRKPKLIYYKKPKLEWTFLKEATINGSSEMVTELSGAVTAVLFNITLLKYAGTPGVAANSVMMYILFLFIAISLGLSMGIQPVISYSYGAKNTEMIKDVMKKSTLTIAILSLVSFLFLQGFGKHLIELFVKDDLRTTELAVHGMHIFSIAFLFNGINILMSGYFTAINNGKISAIISFSRSFIFLIPSILILPQFLKINGIWLTIPLAELITLGMVLIFSRRDKIISNKQLKRVA